MKYYTRPRRFVQYNDLVFEGTVSQNAAPSETFSTKYASNEYLFKNGSYVHTNSNQLLIREHKITLDLAIRTHDWDMDTVRSHVDFIEQQLINRGRLWAVDRGGTIIYANVLLDSYSPNYDWTLRDDGYIIFSVEFTNPEGVWHKADGMMTYLTPYSICSFLDKLSSCFANTDCPCYKNIADTDAGFCEDCMSAAGELADAEPLCALRNEVEIDFYQNCSQNWRLIHNCALAYENNCPETLWGQGKCDTCIDNAITFSFYADTALDTKDLSIILYGTFENPEVTINDDTFVIDGTYTDTHIYYDNKPTLKTFSNPDDLRLNLGSVECQSINKIRYTCGYKPKIKRGFNQIQVRNIKSETACVYIKYDRVKM